MKNCIGIGPSLWPLIRSGSKLSFDPGAVCQVSDLVLYSERGISVCHRVLKKKKIKEHTWYFIKADGKIDADGWIPDYRIQGRLAAINHRPPSFIRKMLSQIVFGLSWTQWTLYQFCFSERAAAACTLP